MTKKVLRKRAWQELQNVVVPPDAAIEHQVVACFQNSHVTVWVKQYNGINFMDPGGKVISWRHLMLTWKIRSASDEEYHEMKCKIVREICGDRCDFVELGPSKWRDLKTKFMHLWVCPPGIVIPFGLLPQDVNGEMDKMSGGNVVTAEDLELCLVSHKSGILEVFASEEDCKKAYGENSIPEDAEMTVGRIGEVPMESPNAAWSDGAKSKLARIIDKSRAATEAQQTYDARTSRPEFFAEVRTIDDEIFDGELGEEEDLGDPVTLEENIAVADAMNKAMLEKAEERARQVREVTESVIGKSSKNLAAVRLASEKPKIIVPK